jgi:macrolide transport system ATP-binding/permease protein
VAVTGPNGAGKSTLLRALLARLDLPPGRLVYLPQELPREETRAALAEARALPHARLGLVMTYVSRLDSRPDRLLESEDPSPGEARKLLLALGMERRPHLVVMDEPTNPLDLPSIECLEAALAEAACALVLVSHDRRFLERLARRWWRVAPDGQDSRLEVSLEPA